VVWYRWPMTSAAWQRFLGIYSRSVDPRPALEHFAFWKIAALAKSAHLRVTQRAEGADLPLGCLASLAAEPRAMTGRGASGSRA
jgi:hypothetical protein